MALYDCLDSSTCYGIYSCTKNLIQRKLPVHRLTFYLLAHGYFEVTADVTQYCKAGFLNTIGKKTPVFVRFSTVAGERGSADQVRDPRGFAYVCMPYLDF